MTVNTAPQIGLILPQCGHLIAGSLNLGGTLNLVPQSQVMALYLLRRHITSEVSRARWASLGFSSFAPGFATASGTTPAVVIVEAAITPL